MKKRIWAVFIICLLSNLSQGQDFSIRLFVTDNSNRKDTIELGLNSSSTLGVDSSLGEQDIYGQAWDSLDMRIIHRDSMEHRCIDSLGYPIYYLNNRDFKVDYRPPTGVFRTRNMQFEILIKSSNPPIIITADFSGMLGSLYNNWSALYLLDSNCYSSDQMSISADPFQDTLYSNDTLTSLLASFEHHVSVNKIRKENINIYPNPITNWLTIDLNDMTESSVVNIQNMNGQTIRHFEFNQERLLQLNINDLPVGLYLVQLIKDNRIQVFKISKTE